MIRRTIILTKTIKYNFEFIVESTVDKVSRFYKVQFVFNKMYNETTKFVLW